MRTITGGGGVGSLTLIRGAVHTFSLLRTLSHSNYPFLFGNNASLVLRLSDTGHLSVSVSVVYPPNAGVRRCLRECSARCKFKRIGLIREVSHVSVPGRRTGFFCRITFPTNNGLSIVLLSILFRRVRCTSIIRLPVRDHFLGVRNRPMVIGLPSGRSLLNSGLATFTPRAANVPFFGKREGYSLRVGGRLFSVTSLFSVVSSLSIAIAAFGGFTKIRLRCEKLGSSSIRSILSSVCGATMYVALENRIRPSRFGVLRRNVAEMHNFVRDRVCGVSSTVIGTTGMTCLSGLVRGNVARIHRCSSTSVGSLTDTAVAAPLPAGFGGLGGSGIRTFFC